MQLNPGIQKQKNKSWWYQVLTHLTFYVLIAIVAGIVLGVSYPAKAVQMEWLGTGFIDIIKIFIGPIIFLTIVLGISGMGDLKKVGRIGFKALVYFEVVSTIALSIGILVALVAKPGEINRAGLPIQDASKFTSSTSTHFNWIHFFETNVVIQVLLLAIITGIALSHSRHRLRVIGFLKKISNYVFLGLKYVMYLAPVGAFGGMAYTIGKFGLKTLLPLAKLLGCVYITMALFIFLILGGIMRHYGLSITKFLKYISYELLLVLGTSSSEPAMPLIMKKLENMGCSKPVVGLVVPTGYSFNLDGTSIYLSMAAIFIAQLYNVPLSVTQLLGMLFILILTSKGAAGVTGSGFIVLASTLAALHTIPLEGLAFLLGIDKFMSEARAITNLIGNGVATLVIAKSEHDFDEKMYEENFLAHY
ncbi:MAG: cation:dicarboxylase symporter family transporter [Ginsengibacter sp.]